MFSFLFNNKFKLLFILLGSYIFLIIYTYTYIQNKIKLSNIVFLIVGISMFGVFSSVISLNLKNYLIQKNLYQNIHIISKYLIIPSFLAYIIFIFEIGYSKTLKEISYIFFPFCIFNLILYLERKNPN